MGRFNKTKFIKQQFIQRVEEVEVNSLHKWFDLSETDRKWFSASSQEKSALIKAGIEPSICYWCVRGLTGSEVANVMSVTEKTRTLSTLVEAISNKSNVDDIKEAIGIGTDTPLDIAKRLEQLVYGSVDPVMSHDVAIKLAENFPVEFYVLTNTINKLTGLGMDLKK